MPGKGEQDIHWAPVFGESTGNGAITRPTRRSQGPRPATNPPADDCREAWAEGIAQRRGHRRHFQHGVQYITTRSYCSTGRSYFLLVQFLPRWSKFVPKSSGCSQDLSPPEV